jgi:hypothetical protein
MINRVILAFFAIVALVAFTALSASAQNSRAVVVTTCGQAGLAGMVGQSVPLTVDVNGNLCGGGTVNSKIGPFTIVPLDTATVTTGGVAVTALATGHALAGGFLITSNAAGICVDQATTAGTVTGTPSTTSCVAQGQVFSLVPNSHAVSVNSTASNVSLAGEGWQ